MTNLASRRRCSRFDRDVRGSKRARFKAIALVTVKPGIPLNTPRKGTRGRVSPWTLQHSGHVRTRRQCYFACPARRHLNKKKTRTIRKTRMKLFRATSGDLFARDSAKTSGYIPSVGEEEYFNRLVVGYGDHNSSLLFSRPANGNTEGNLGASNLLKYTSKSSVWRARINEVHFDENFSVYFWLGAVWSQNKRKPCGNRRRNDKLCSLVQWIEIDFLCCLLVEIVVWIKKIGMFNLQHSELSYLWISH